MKEMTDEQVVEVLARREGWRLFHDDHETIWVGPGEKWVEMPPWKERGMKEGDGRPGIPIVDVSALPPYPTSHDALRPVLLGLSPEEQRKLCTMIEVSYMDDNYEGSLLIYTITLTADKLARIVAEVLSEGKEQ